MKFQLIVTAVKPDLTDDLIDAAKEAGATGATIIPARGVGIHEAKSFFGLTLEAQTDLILFLLEEHLVDPVLETLSKQGKFQEPGTGIAFVLPVGKTAGLESQLDKFSEEIRKRNS